MSTEPTMVWNRVRAALGTVALSTAFALTAGILPASAQSDPSKPTSDRHALPPPGGGGGNPDRKVALGMSMPNATNLATLDAFTDTIGGHQPALWSLWVQWGGSNTVFPAATIGGLRQRGVIPFIFWEPWDPSDSDDPAFRFAAIVAGEHDAYIRQFARAAQNHGGPVLLRFAHEANGRYFPWGVGGILGNTVEQYKLAWRHVHDIFRQEGASNVRFVWSVTRQPCQGGCNPYTAFYPGDRYVDYMGFSAFNWGLDGSHQWTSMYDAYRMVTAKLAEISDKPILVAETASNSVGGDKPQWIRDGYREVYDRLPRIVAILYLNFDLTYLDHPDWSLSNPAAALTAYREIASLSRFQGQLATSHRIRSRPGTHRRQRDEAPQHDRDRQRLRKTTPREPVRDPRVQKGSDGSEAGEAGSSARSETQRAKRRQRDEDPPLVVDTFSR